MVLKGKERVEGRCGRMEEHWDEERKDCSVFYFILVFRKKRKTHVVRFSRVSISQTT